jgi:hypothetical protein
MVLSILDTMERSGQQNFLTLLSLSRLWNKPVHFGQFLISKWMVLITPDYSPTCTATIYGNFLTFLTCQSGSPQQHASRAAPPAATSTRKICPGRRTPASRPTTYGCPPSSSSALGWLASRGCCGGATWSTASSRRCW